MKLITSRNNPKIKAVRALRQRKFRQETGLFRVEGIFPVGEAVAAGIPIDALYYAPDLLSSEFARQLLADQAAAGIPEPTRASRYRPLPACRPANLCPGQLPLGRGSRRAARPRQHRCHNAHDRRCWRQRADPVR